MRREDSAMLDGLAARAEALVARAVSWCEINSGSGNLEGLERLADQLAAAFAVLPGTVERIALAPSRGVDSEGREIERLHPAALRLVVRPEAPVQVALTGHSDTVYPAGSPFQTVRARTDGALHGPGVADMKGGLSVMLGALEAFERHPEAGRLGYRVLISPDEEIGSPASAPLLAELARAAAVGLTYEPAIGPEGALASARKGSGNFDVVVEGRAAHAGRDFAAGRNAVAAAAALATRLDALNGRLDEATVNIAKLDGGGPLNAVPDRAVLRFNVRVPDPTTAERALAAIDAAVAEIAAAREVRIQRRGGFHRPAKPATAAQRQLFDAVTDTGAMLGLDIAWRASGGVCEGNNLFAAGLPNVDTLGVRGGDIHSEHEFAWPDSFAERARLSALLLARLARGEIIPPQAAAAE